MEPIGRTTSLSIYSPGGERPTVLHGTWLEAESFAYPNGGFTRRAYVAIRSNPNNPDLDLPYDQKRRVTCSVPDTYFSIPARLRYKGQTVKGFITIENPGSDWALFTFTPEAKKGE